MCNKNEVWLPVKNFEGLYEVSNLGNIRSLSRIIIQRDGIKRYFYGKILSQRINKKRYNYCEVNLKNSGNIKTMKVHRIVAEAFLKNENNLPQINHKDFNPENNNVNNLEWCSAKYNINYSKHRRKNLRGTYGRKIIAYDINNNYIGEYGSIREAARQLNCNGQNICSVLSNKIKRTKGYYFQDMALRNGQEKNWKK